MKAWLVIGNDVGGNGGTVVIAAFTSEEDANHWATESPRRQSNNAGWDNAGDAFEVEECEVFQSIAEAEESKR